MSFEISLESLRAEHRETRVGPEWLRVVRAVCSQIVLAYPPRVYGGVERWDEGTEDLVQDVVLSALLEDHQAEYLMAQADSAEDFRRLLGRQVRHVLAQRRTKTVIDQLLRRCRRLLADPSRFEAVASAGGSRCWRVAGQHTEERSATLGEIRRAALAARQIPRIPYRGSVRAPKVYTDESLRRLLELVAVTLPVPFGTRDLDRIFVEVLTDFLPRNLDSVVRPGLTTDRPDEEYEVSEVAERVVARLSKEQAAVIAAKLSGSSDADLAAILGVSRPTAAKRKEAALAVVSEEFRDLDPALRDRVLERLSLLVASPSIVVRRRQQR